MCRSGRGQLLNRVVAARHRDRYGTGCVGSVDVARRVADDEDIRRGELTVEAGGLLDGEPGQLWPIGRVRAVRAEEEEAVEVGRHELGARGAFHSAGDKPQNHAGIAEPYQELFRPSKDSVLR